MSVWNYHRIQSTRNITEPTGRPAALYASPELDQLDQLVSVETDDVLVRIDECTFKSDIPCDKDFFNLCCGLMEEHDLEPPSTPRNAVDLYHTLKYLILKVL